jgi:uncharacterized protein (DUF58 family)
MARERRPRWWATSARVALAARRLGRRVADVFPVTPLGLLVAGSAYAAMRFFGVEQLDLVLLVVGYAGLGLPAVAVVLVALGALVLKLRKLPTRVDGDAALRLETRRVAPTGLVVPSLWWLPLVQVSWQWERPEGVRVVPQRRFGKLLEEVVARERGEHAGLRRRLVVEDALGLARLAIRKDEPRALVVLPTAGALRSVPALASFAGGDDQPHPLGIEEGDRIDLRRYAPGDPARFIHWKVFARTGKLMVRRHERALVQARRTVAYLVAGPGDDATAGAARVALETHALGAEWVFGADGGDAAGTSSVSEAVSLIVRSAAQRDDGAGGLAAFLARADREGPASLVVFVPPEPGPWLARVLAQLARRRHVRVVVAIDAVAPPPPRQRWRLWLARALAHAVPRFGTPAERLEGVLRTLAGARAEVLLFDRTTGRALGEAHRRAMLSPADEPGRSRAKARAPEAA